MKLQQQSERLRVWDLPTRLFHWALAACVIGLIITGKVGGAAIEWHARLGQTVLALLLFRLVWGVIGGHWSRFVHFVPGPSRLLRYLRGQGGPAQMGHNPLGALSVLAMLGVLLAQALSGMVSDDEIAFTGPWNRWVSSAFGLAATTYHRSIGQWALIALIVLHLGAIAWHQWRLREGLVQAMLHGDKWVDRPALADERHPASADTWRSRLLAAWVFALSAGLVMVLATLAT